MRAPARRMKSAQRIVIDTAAASRVECDLGASRELLVDQHLEAEEVAEGWDGSGGASGERQELVGRDEPEAPGAEQRAEPRVVDPPVGGQNDVHRPVVGADDERFGARLERCPANGRCLGAGPDRRMLEDPERHAGRREPRGEPRGDRRLRRRLGLHGVSIGASGEPGPVPRGLGVRLGPVPRRRPR